MSELGVMRPGHVCLRVTDMAAAVRHYTEFVGLIEVARDAGGRVYLKAWDEFDHHSVILREADAPGMDFLGFKVDGPERLERLADGLRRAGCTLEVIPADDLQGCGQRVRFRIPGGHAVELYSEKRAIGNGVAEINPAPWPASLKGLKPSRFDHSVLRGPNVDDSRRLFENVLGFRLTERVIDGERLVGAYLSCGNKPCDVAFVEGPEPGILENIAFGVDAGETLAQSLADAHLPGTTPGTEAPPLAFARGTSAFFADPSGNRNHVFSGGYLSYPDKPVLTWTIDRVGRAAAEFLQIDL